MCLDLVEHRIRTRRILFQISTQLGRSGVCTPCHSFWQKGGHSRWEHHETTGVFVFLSVYTLLSYHGKFGSFSSRKANCNGAALPNPNSLLSACWFFSCFHNPPNSDVDYRIVNVPTWSFLCMRVHTGTAWAHRQRVSTTFFDMEKLSQFFSCASDAGGIRTSVKKNTSSPKLYQQSHPVT